jgi:hypothetical protein
MRDVLIRGPSLLAVVRSMTGTEFLPLIGAATQAVSSGEL